MQLDTLSDCKDANISKCNKTSVTKVIPAIIKAGKPTAKAVEEEMAENEGVGSRRGPYIDPYVGTDLYL